MHPHMPPHLQIPVLSLSVLMHSAGLPASRSLSAHPSEEDVTCNLHPCGQGQAPCTCDTVMPAHSSAQVAPVPLLLPLGREHGQNTCVDPAQTFAVHVRAEGTQSCFIFLVFLVSLRSKKGRQGCFQHRELGDNGEASLYLLGSPEASM